MKKSIIIVIIAVIIVALTILVLSQRSTDDQTPDFNQTASTTDELVDDVMEEDQFATQAVIGRSANSNDVVAYHYGNGDTELLFVGGIHGGYSWNTALVAYELVDYLEKNPERVPANIRVTVVPVLNPDGLEEVVGTTGKFNASEAPTSETLTVPGRFNGNGVDLNRNFDCDWQSVGVWQNKDVDGGDSAFSEPESQAIRDLIDNIDPEAVVVWYSSAGGVFASNCHQGVLNETSEILNIFADASGYPAYENFDYYEVTGDMTNWLAKEGIPAISVLLSDHKSVEWSQNRAGVEALLEYYGKTTE